VPRLRVCGALLALGTRATNPTLIDDGLPETINALIGPYLNFIQALIVSQMKKLSLGVTLEMRILISSVHPTSDHGYLARSVKRR
jgi:hypothetical protein